MNIKNTYIDIQNWVKHITLFSALLLMGTFSYAQTPEYATFSGGLSGTGNFTCSESPDFTYTITGDVAPGDTSVPGPSQVIDNGGGGLEAIYGQADNAQNIEVEVAGFGGGNGGGIGATIVNTVVTTINFDAPTTPGALAFVMADVEQDQVQVCALDANGAVVPNAVINGWFMNAFNADNAGGATPPTWDAATATLVGQFASSPVRQTAYVADLPDNEAGAAWFEVDIAITQLQFKSQALGVNPDDPSQHFLIATRCLEPTCDDLADEPTLCEYIIENPTSDIALADCDGGGISNLIECETGGNPNDPVDDCMSLMNAGIDFCEFLADNPDSPFGAVDCDNGGVDNLTECLAGQDPKDPMDDTPMTPCEAPMCTPVPNLMVCSDGTTRTIACEMGLENGNVVWFNGMGEQVATGCEFVIDNTFIQNGAVGDMMCFFYEAIDENGCPITSCCPIIAEVVDCGFYDLALIKETTSMGPFVPGDDVTFTITVCNQGTLDAANVEITDLIPADMSLSSADTNGWSGPSAGPVTNVISSLVAGACTPIDIVLTIDSTFMGNSIVNNAIITADDGDDIDSDPSIIDALDDFADDNDLDETDGGDDEDPEEIMIGQIYDLALIKETVTQGPFSAGDNVTFAITVCNQGTLDAANIQVTDNLPMGLSLSTSDPNGWAGPLSGPVVNSSITSLPAGTCSVLEIITTIDGNFQGTSLINNAEISADDGNDIDSSPGDNSQPNDLVDDDDLSESDGGDDEDPEEIIIEQIYDLALIKETVSPGPFAPGDDVTFAITVCNQGTLDAANIAVTDNIPNGLTLSLADGNGWAGPLTGPVVNSTITTLPVGACSVLEIIMTIDETFMGTSIINNAEISADDGNDIDSTPGDNSQPDDLGDDDNFMESDGGDDEDPEEIVIEQIYDLALIKETATPGPYSPGDDVTYTITVQNQGTLDAGAITLTDFIPAGMTLSVNDTNGWAAAGSTATNSLTGPIIASAITVDIVLTIDSTFMGTTLVNFAEISADSGNDIDSTPDAVNGNDPGGAVNTPSDDVLTGDGLGMPGDAVGATDEDDHDPEDIILEQIYDLALIKEEVPAGPYLPGDDVTYTITVENQGTLDAGAITLTDFIPTGMSLSVNDTNGWMAAGATATNAVTGPVVGTSITVDIVLTIDPTFPGGTIINFAEISSDSGNDIDSTPDATNGNDAGGLVNTASDDVLTGDGLGMPGDAVGATDEDDHDPEDIVVQIFDLALTKTLNAATPGPFSPGSAVTFDINLFNQGTVDAFNVGVLDNIPAGLTLADANWTAAGGVATLNNPVTFIPAGGTVTQTITFVVDPGVSGTLVNDAEIASADDDTNPANTPPVDIDSTPGDGATPLDLPNNDDTADTAGGDDHDPEPIEIEIFDLALTKTLNAATPGPFTTGSTVTFDINVFNQGGVNAFNIGLLDQIPAGLTLADPNWTAAGGVATLNTPIPFLAAGASTTEMITFTVDPGVSGTLINDAEIASADDDTNPGNMGPTDIDSTPGDDATPDDLPNNDDTADTAGGDDHDPEPIVVEIFDLALAKTVNAATPAPYVPGDVVTFDITVTNQGTLNAFSIGVDDYVPAGLILADANWTLNGTTASLNNPISFLAPGQSNTLTITFQIDPSFMGTMLVNDSEISSADDDTNPGNTPPTDVDSTPADMATPNDLGNNDVISDTAGGDDHDPEPITIGQIYDLALIKVETSVGPYMPGDDVDFTITVCNQGSLDAANIQIADNLPSGLTLSTADMNGWSGPNTGPVTNMIPSLLVGACTDIDITLTIDPTFQGNILVNNAEITVDDGNDVDSTPGDNSQPNDFPDDNIFTETDGGDDEDPEAIVVEQLFDLALIKEEASTGPYIPGDDVNYTITVCNQGSLNAFNVEITDYIPADMTLSVNDANGWSASGIGQVANVIPSIPIGTCQMVDILLTIDPAFAGGDIINFAEISADNNGTDIDSTPDAVNGNDAGGNPTTPSDNELMGNGTGVIGDMVAATDEDDHDPELITVETFDLALIKTVNMNTPGPFEPGDVVTFDITVTNQGTTNAFAIGVNDYVPAGLTLADANWTLAGTTATLNSPISFLAPGQSFTTTITFLIDSAFTGASIINDAEIASADNNTNPGDTPPTDVDSTPGDMATPNDLPGNDDVMDTMGGDDHDPEMIVIEQDPDIFDLALIKTVSANTPGPYMPGGLVTFDLTVMNQGNVNAFNIDITDYIPAGLILADANWTQVGPNAVLTNAIPFLAMGASSTVTITFQIDPTVGSGFILNDSEISSADDDTNPANTPLADIDSTPGDNATPDDLPNNDDLADTAGGDDQDPEGIQVCSNANAGIVVEGSMNSCLLAGGTTSRNAIPSGQVVPPGDSLVYILVDVNGNILQTSDMPQFIIGMTGDFTIHPVVFDPNQCDVTALTTVDAIFDSCVCFDIDLVGAPVEVTECCFANAGGLIEANVDGCADTGATFTAFPVGTNVPAGSSVLYILTTGPSNTIVATSPTPSFNITTPGTFAIHTFVFDPATFNLGSFMIGVDPISVINQEIITEGICGSINLLGTSAEVEACEDDCPINLFIPGPGICIPSGLYEAQNDIISDGTVCPGSVVEFSAGNSVTLIYPFEVQLGGEFEAFIEGCDPE